MCKRLMYLVSCFIVLVLASSVSADLVGYWKLDEGGGTTAFDSSGNGNDGTLEDGPTVVQGQYGLALAFEGSRVDVPASDSLGADMFQGSFTLSAWVKPTRTGNTWQQIFRAFTTTGNDTLFVNNDGRLSWRGFVGGTWAGGMCETAAGVVPADQWTHVAVTGDETNFRIYVNGALSQESAFQTTDGANTAYYFGGDPVAAGESYSGAIDDIAIFDHALTEGEVQKAMKGIAAAELASVPNPEDEATDVLRDITLRWEPGDFAATHDVYLGTVFDDVNDASRADGMDVLVSQGQVDTTYDAGRLEFGQTFYWRIDEVNAAPESTIFKGKVWSFTVEPFAYAVADVTATSNGISEDGVGAENTVNGSGLNEVDEHSTVSTDMWLAAPGTDPLSIQYEFDRVYKLHEMLVWNYNVQFELMLGFGLKDITVEYSTDGAEWVVLGDVQLAQATAKSDYMANSTVAFGGVAARFVRLIVNSGYGPMGQFGLSEVRFMQIPAHARDPQPTDGATEVSVATVLTWRAGREVASHVVSLGTDPDALAMAGTAEVPSFDPGTLDLGAIYYWQVDEVNETEAIGSWEGDLWSFSTQEYIVVDDFESYDDEDNRIFDAWLDGFVNDTGSTVGYFEAPFAETVIVHGGSQAMPLFYDNAQVATSEAEFELSQDWTASGIKSLSLYFHGAPDNGGQLYVKINDTVVAYDGAATDIVESLWMPWNIDLSAVGGNLSSVTKLTIGIEGAGASGVVYFDDIRLYPQTPEFVVPTEPDEAGLVAHYAFDSDLNDAAGAHPGTAMGDAQLAADPARGQVLLLDGGGDAVEVAYSAELNPEAFTASLWANPDPAGSNYRSPLTSRDDGPQRGYILYLTPGNTWQFWTGTGAGWDNTAGPAAVLGEWTHLAATSENEEKALYVNGRLVAQGSAPLGLNTARPLRIGGGATEGPGNYFFQGMLDEVRLYNQALSPEEVAGLAGRTEPLHKPF